METLSLSVLTYLANAIWEVAVVAVAAALADRFVRRAPTRYRHALWVIALAVAALLPLASLPLPYRKKGTIAVTAGDGRTAAELPSSDNSSIGQFDNTPETALHHLPLRSRSSHPLRDDWHLAVNRFLAYALLALYTAFLLFRLSKLVRAWRKTVQLRAAAFHRDLPEPMASIYAQSRSALGWQPSFDPATESPEFLFSSAVSLPVALGALRPAIVFPESLIEKMDSSELTAALAHELAHVRRRDYLVNLFAEMFLLPISFHPLAIFLKRRIDQTRELASDELAAGSLDSSASYARALVSLARRIAVPALAAVQPVGYTLGVLETDNLEERIMKLMDQNSAISKRVVWLSVAFAFILLAGTGLATSMFSVAPSLQQAAIQAPQEENTGGVTGVVTDPIGARMPGAVVTLSSKQKNFQQKVVTTNQEGEYAFQSLAPGMYNLEVQKPSIHARFYRTVLIGPAQQKAEFKGQPYEFAPTQPFVPVVINLAPVNWITVVKAKATPGMAHEPVTPGPNRIRLGSQVEAAKRIGGPLPEYPEEARAKGIEGNVELRAVISVEGNPLSLNVISSPDPALSDAALKAVRQWRYKPTLLNGVPAEVVTDITVRFQLER